MFPERKIIEGLKRNYPKGTRIKLIKMDDPHAVPLGTLGTVTGADDIGSLLVDWDNGQSLHLLYGEDACIKVSPEEEQLIIREKLEVLVGQIVRNRTNALSDLLLPYFRVRSLDHLGNFIFEAKLSNGFRIQLHTAPVDDEEMKIKIERIEVW